MKNVKSILLSGLLVFASVALVFTSCNSDPCNNVVCNNGGLCVDGTCDCEAGYEGESCDNLSMTKYLGTWTANDVERGTSTTLAYSATIGDANLGVQDVIINGISDGYFTNNVTATVDGNTITIPPQEPDNDGYKIDGVGTYDETTQTIVWDYALLDPLNQSIVYDGTWN